MQRKAVNVPAALWRPRSAKHQPVCCRAARCVRAHYPRRAYAHVLERPALNALGCFVCSCRLPKPGYLRIKQAKGMLATTTGVHPTFGWLDAHRRPSWSLAAGCGCDSVALDSMPSWLFFYAATAVESMPWHLVIPQPPDPHLDEIAENMRSVKHIILVLSGKGGVGKRYAHCRVTGQAHAQRSRAYWAYWA